jgi:hypothetical protein
VTIGGGREPDDYGLPPVDIEIPDDARELDRDVLAYYREQRAARRRALARRLYRPLTRDSLVLPVLAACLALTLLAGAMLTVFSGEPGFIRTLPGKTARGQALSGGPGSTWMAPASASPAAAGQPGSRLPDILVDISGNRAPFAALVGRVRVLALVPATCGCLRDLRGLASQAQRASAQIYLVGTSVRQLLLLARRVGLGEAHAVVDTSGALPPAYHPRILTALVVRADDTITARVPDRGHGILLTAPLRALASASPAATTPVASSPAGSARAG